MDPEPAQRFLENPLVYLLLVIILLLVLSLIALISATEVAYFSSSKQRIEELLEKYPKQAGKYQKLLSKPVKLQTTLNITSVVFKIVFIITALQLKFYWLDHYLENFFATVIFFIVVIFCILFFGEVLPRIYAYRNTNLFIKSSINTVIFLNVVFTPFVHPLKKLSVWLTAKLHKADDTFSVEQLSQALEMTDYSETTEEEQKILEGIVSFGATEVSQVMTPRIDVFAIKSTAQFQEILPKIIDKGFSRIPVYEENIDQVLGVLFVKDLIPHIEKKMFNWLPLIREAYFIPENKKLDDLLKDFQTKKNHLAVVVDEFGETAGIITLEDILEEIVGEITDEFDDEEENYTQIDPNNYLFDGKISMKDFYRVLPFFEDDLEEFRREAETLAGFYLEQSESHPEINDEIEVAGVTFKITDADNRRIHQIRVTFDHEKNED